MVGTVAVVRPDDVVVLPVRVRVGWVLLLLAPIALWPWASEPYALPKAALAALGAVLVLSGPRTSVLSRPLALLLGAAAVVLALAAVLSETPVASLVGRYPRYEGAFVIGTYLAVIVAGARLRPSLHRLAVLTIAVLSGSAGVVLLDAVVESGGSTGARAGSLLGNATDLGVWGALAALWLLGLSQDRTSPWRWVAYAGAAAGVADVAVSGSRSGVAALAVGLVALLVVRFRDRELRWAVAGALVALPVLVLAAPGAADRVTGSDPVAAATATGRALLWEDSARLVSQHPFLGVGPSSYVDWVGTAHGPRWAAEVGPQSPPDTPHALLLQAGAAGGVPLALLLLGCAGVVAFAAWQSARESVALAGISASLLAYAVAVSVNFTTPGTTVVASLAVGLVAARAAGSVPRPGARLVPVLAAGLCGAVLMFAVAGEVLVGQADSAMAAGDVAGASGAWDSAAALRPSDVDVALRHGRSFTSAVDAGLAAKPECLSSTEAAWAALPRSSEAATDRAHCLELNARYGDAEAVLAAATDHDPVNVDLWLLRGVVAAEGGDTAAAIGHLTRATELRPTASEAWTDLAVVHRMRGETAAAAAADTRARQLASAEGR